MEFPFQLSLLILPSAVWVVLSWIHKDLHTWRMSSLQEPWIIMMMMMIR